MDLKTFIATTLTQIVEGVAQAQEVIAAGETNAVLNPVHRSYHEKNKSEGNSSPVEFDVAVTVTDEGGSGIKGGLAIAGFVKFGGESEEKSSSERISRVKFTVNLAQPSFVKIGAPPAPVPLSGAGSWG